jgi:hypothetical protein
MSIAEYFIDTSDSMFDGEDPFRVLTSLIESSVPFDFFDEDIGVLYFLDETTSREVKLHQNPGEGYVTLSYFTPEDNLRFIEYLILSNELNLIEFKDKALSPIDELKRDYKFPKFGHDLVIGPYVVNDSMQVFNGDSEPITTFTKAEYGLLRVLVENSNFTVPYHEIALKTTSWVPGSGEPVDILRTRMTRLSTKGGGILRDFLSTTRGVGYKIINAYVQKV